MNEPLDSERRPPGLAYAHLNLVRNPFGEIPLSQRGAVAVVDVEAYLQPLAEERIAVQVLGDKGHGKTTHLLALRENFRDAPYLHVAEGERPTSFPEGEPLFLDELQRVPREARRALFRSSRALVLGTHRDFEGELRRAGLRVETLRPGGLLSRARLGRILERRFEWARRGPGPIPEVRSATILRLLEQYGSDVRAMEHDLFERVCELEAVGRI